MGSDRKTRISTGAFRRSHLKAVLVVGDAIAIALGYAATLAFTTSGDRHDLVGALAVTVTAATVGLWAVHMQGLHLARVSAVRAIELSRTARAIAILTASMLLADRVAHLGFRLRDVIPASVTALVLLCVWRSMFRSSMAHARADGRHLRRVVVIGTGDESGRVVELCATHREVGFVVVGVIGDPIEAAVYGLSEYWLGTVDDAEDLVATAELSGVFVTPGALSAERMKQLLRNLQRLNLHVHLTTGICGLDSRRIRLLPLAHEPLLYLEAPALSPMRIIAKRCFDVVLATALLLVLSPVMLVIALSVALQDGGPILFVQQRVGRDGHLFGVLKFRTMCVDAESRLCELDVANERNGPLFKMVKDPRVTRLGRFLRESSLDELPQLLNVLRGEMSLVGPRPALPAEVASFSAELRTREKVLPGITGLWQVEARDNPSFAAYQRLDLFYVENWSSTLDLMIVLATIEQLVGRVVRIMVRRRPIDPSSSVVAAVATAGSASSAAR